MSDVEFYGENEKSDTRFAPQRPQRWQMGERGMVGLVMRWFGITNESTANYVLIAVAVVFFIASAILFF